MSLRPYSDHPIRRVLQFLSDLFVIAWVAAWAWVGKFVHDVVAAMAQAGFMLQSGAAGLSSSLNDAGRNVGGVPLVGDKLATPLTSAGGAAAGLAGAGKDLGDNILTTALVMGLLVALVPAAFALVIWGALRLRFARRAAGSAALSRSPGGERLLALRALSSRPLRQLAAVSDDPVEAWMRDDTEAVRALAALELRRSGVRPPRQISA
jgi:hypothetical protein